MDQVLVHTKSVWFLRDGETRARDQVSKDKAGMPTDALESTSRTTSVMVGNPFG